MIKWSLHFFSKPYGNFAGVFYTLAPNKQEAFKQFKYQSKEHNWKGFFNGENYEWFMIEDDGLGKSRNIAEFQRRKINQKENIQKKEIETKEKKQLENIAKKEHICPNCGIYMEKDFCEECGFDLHSGTKFSKNWFNSFLKQELSNKK